VEGTAVFTAEPGEANDVRAGGPGLGTLTEIGALADSVVP
jgi:hypothetical protein